MNALKWVRIAEASCNALSACANGYGAWDDVMVDRGSVASHNAIRQLDAHASGRNTHARLKELAETFGLDIENARGRYGLMLDAVYDKLSEALFALGELLRG